MLYSVCGEECGLVEFYTWVVWGINLLVSILLVSDLKGFLIYG